MIEFFLFVLSVSLLKNRTLIRKTGFRDTKPFEVCFLWIDTTEVNPPQV